jgi:hypothetical protein
MRLQGDSETTGQGRLPNAGAPDLSIVVVTHRTATDVRNCLVSLLHDGGMDGLDAHSEVIVIDNASGDGTAEMIRAEFPSVRLIANAENVGYSRGNNQGIEAATGRNVLLLNPDTIVPRGELAKCVEFLDGQDPKVAAMSCRVESTDGSLQWTCSRRLITPWSECCRALLLDRAFKNSDLFNPEPQVHWDRSDTRPVECLLGAFMLIRRTALEKLGGLDERFFLMYEDVDWCRRARDAGYTLLFWPGARITHIGGGFWKQEPVVVFANAHLSGMTYFRKHHPRAVGLVRAVSRAGMEVKIALLRLNLLRRPGDAYTLKHLEMARAARQTLKTGGAIQYGKWAETAAGGPKPKAAGGV